MLISAQWMTYNNSSRSWLEIMPESQNYKQYWVFFIPLCSDTLESSLSEFWLRFLGSDRLHSWLVSKHQFSVKSFQYIGVHHFHFPLTTQAARCSLLPDRNDEDNFCDKIPNHVDLQNHGSHVDTSDSKQGSGIPDSKKMRSSSSRRSSQSVFLSVVDSKTSENAEHNRESIGEPIPNEIWKAHIFTYIFLSILRQRWLFSRAVLDLSCADVLFRFYLCVPNYYTSPVLKLATCRYRKLFDSEVFLVRGILSLDSLSNRSVTLNQMKSWASFRVFASLVALAQGSPILGWNNFEDSRNWMWMKE